MRTDRIYNGFVAWFGDGAFLWVVLVVMLLLSLVFITFPLLTGVLAVKYGKTLGIKKKGGFGVIVLPVLEKMNAAKSEEEESSECAECACACAACAVEEEEE